MATNSSIEWTDATWNPVTGCSKVSPGCAHCYAETVAMRFWPTQYPPIRKVVGAIQFTNLDGTPATRPRAFTDVMCHDDRLDQPFRWRKPRRIFVNSMSDLFHEDVPDTFIDVVFAVMTLASKHTFQVLTKRPQRMLAYLSKSGRRSQVEWTRTNYQQQIEASWSKSELLTAYAKTDAEWDRVYRTWPLSNVWLGVSVENQRFADERIPLLLQTPAAVRFISAEPLLGPVDLMGSALSGWCPEHDFTGGFCVGPECEPRRRVDWVIVGGESGRGARNCSAQWIRSVVRQCKDAHVPVFVKQVGARVIDRNDAGFDGCTPGSWPSAIEERDGVEDHIHGFREDYQGADVRVHLLNRKGGDPSEWPEDLRIRQFPAASREA